MNLGADGLKTGYTEEAGYGLIASAKQEGGGLEQSFYKISLVDLKNVWHQ